MNARVILVAALVVMVCACDGSKTTPSRAKECGDERERPFCREVADAQSLTASERSRKFVELAANLEPASETKLLRGGRTVYELVLELLAQEDYAVLKGLVNGLSGRRLEVLVTGLRAKADRPPVHALLADVAAKDPTNVRLMAFRKDGIEDLLKCVGDTTASASERGDCAFELGLYADESVLGRLQRLEKDETPFEGPQTGGLIGSAEVLGDRIRAAMEHIRRRAKK